MRYWAEKQKTASSSSSPPNHSVGEKVNSWGSYLPSRASSQDSTWQSVAFPSQQIDERSRSMGGYEVAWGNPGLCRSVWPALNVRQILQSALVVRWGNLWCFPPNFSHRRPRLAGPLLPLRRMHEIFWGRRARDPVRGGGELWLPLPRSRDKWARLSAA